MQEGSSHHMSMSAESQETDSDEVRRGGNNNSSCYCRGVPLLVIFGLQMCLVMGAFIGVTVMFVVTQRAELDRNVQSIVTKSLLETATHISDALQLHQRSVSTITDIMVSNPFVYQSRYLNESNMSSFRPLYALLRSAIRKNPYVAFLYQNFDTREPCPLNTSYTIITETNIGAGGFMIYVDTDSVKHYYPALPDTAPNNPALFNLTTAASEVVLNAAFDYVISAISTNATHDVWTPPYFWIDISQVVLLLSYYQCVVPNVATGGCLVSFGEDMNLNYVSSVLGTFRSSPASVIAVADLRGMTLMATTDSSFVIHDAGAPWPILSTPSPRINEAMTLFFAACGEGGGAAAATTNSNISSAFSGCMYFDVGATWIYSVKTVQPFSGITFAVLEITPRSYYYSDSDDTLKASIVVVTTLGVLVFVSVAAVYASVSRSLDQLLLQFKDAESFDYENVVGLGSSKRQHSIGGGPSPTAGSDSASIVSLDSQRSGSFGALRWLRFQLRELAMIHDAFVALVEKLVEARAFLPHSLFQKSVKRGSSRNGPSSGGGSFEEIFDAPPANEGAGWVARAAGVDGGDESALDDNQPDIHIQVPSTAAAQPPTNPLNCVSPSASRTQWLQLPTTSRKPQAGNMWPRPKGLNVSAALVTRRVTVVFANVCNFHDLCRSEGPIGAQRALSYFLQLIVDAAADLRGIVDFFHGDHVMASFNASTNCVNQGIKAATFILRIRDGLATPSPSTQLISSGGAVPSSTTFLPPPSYQSTTRFEAVFGAATGTSICGNFGTEKLRRFCVVGPIVNQAFALVQHAKLERVPTLVSPAACDIMKEDVVLLHQSFVSLTIGSGKTVPSIISNILRLRHDPESSPNTMHGEPHGHAEDSGDATATAPSAGAASRRGRSSTHQKHQPNTMFEDTRLIDLSNVGFEMIERGDILEARRVADQLEQQHGVTPADNVLKRFLDINTTQNYDTAAAAADNRL